MVKIFKKVLIFLGIAKQEGEYADGTPVLVGINKYNPLSFLFMILWSPVVGIVEGCKAIYTLWLESTGSK